MMVTNPLIAQVSDLGWIVMALGRHAIASGIDSFRVHSQSSGAIDDETHSLDPV